MTKLLHKLTSILTDDVIANVNLIDPELFSYSPLLINKVSDKLLMDPGMIVYQVCHARIIVCHARIVVLPR